MVYIEIVSPTLVFCLGSLGERISQSDLQCLSFPCPLLPLKKLFHSHMRPQMSP